MNDKEKILVQQEKTAEALRILDEISVDVDSTKQARYFEQAEYGKYTRAALLGLILNEKGF